MEVLAARVNSGQKVSRCDYSFLPSARQFSFSTMPRSSTFSTLWITYRPFFPCTCMLGRMPVLNQIDTVTYNCVVACPDRRTSTVSYTHLRAHETGRNLVCRLLLE